MAAASLFEQLLLQEAAARFTVLVTLGQKPK